MVDRASRVKADEVPMPSFRIGVLSRPLPKTKNFRGYIAEGQALQDRSEQEVRLHEAIEEIYGPYDPIEALIDQLFPEKPKEKITLPIVSLPVLYQISPPKVIPEHRTTEAKVPDPVINELPVPNQTILDFDNARRILAPLIEMLQGKVTVNDFEEACKFFLELGSKDIDTVYQMEKELTRRVPLASVPQAILEIKDRISSGGSQAKILQQALDRAGIDLNSLAGKADNTFSSHFAKIFFFLKALAPNYISDGDIFNNFAKPLFEMIAERSSGDLKKPKRPNPGKIGNRNTLKQKQRTFQAQLKKYEAELEKFIPEIYNFIIEKLDGSAPALITQRLSELSN